MLKNITRRGAWLGAAALIVMTIAPAQAASTRIAQSDSSAITATGSLVGEQGLDLNTNKCAAKAKNSTSNGEGLCGNGLDTLANIDAVTQVATAKNNATSGVSAAAAGTTAIDLLNLTSIDLNDVINNGLGGLQTGTVLDSLLTPLANLLAGIGVQLGDLFTQLDGVLDQVTSPLDDALPVSLKLDSVDSSATATAGTKKVNGKTVDDDTKDEAKGSGEVAGLRLTIGIGGQVIDVPLTADTAPNSDLIADAPQALVNAILDAVKDTLTNSLGGVLTPAIQLIVPIQDVVNQLLDALGPALLQPLSDALAGIVHGTVNKQVYKGSNTTVTENGKEGKVVGKNAELEVTALDIVLLDAAGAGGRQELAIGRSHVGPNDIGAPGDNNNGGGKTDFQVLKTEKIKGDNKIEWTIKVRNPKSATAHDVVVKDFYPKGIKGDVKVEEGPSTGTFNEDTGVWKIPTLGGKKVATLVIKAKVKTGKLDDGIKNTACAVTKNGAFRNISDDKPDKIQKNDTFNDDTDGCDTSGSQKDKDDDDDTPKKIDSGVNGAGNLGALAATGLLAVAALGGTAVRQRRFVA